MVRDRQTDRRTDGRTDGPPDIATYRAAIAAKKVKIDLFIDLFEPSIRISSILLVGIMSTKYVIRMIETYLNVYALPLLNTLEIANIPLTAS